MVRGDAAFGHVRIGSSLARLVLPRPWLVILPDYLIFFALRRAATGINGRRRNAAATG
jgi:hypothetical protein